MEHHTVGSRWLWWDQRLSVDFPHWITLWISSGEPGQADGRGTLGFFDWEVTDSAGVRGSNLSPGYLSDSWLRLQDELGRRLGTENHSQLDGVGWGLGGNNGENKHVLRACTVLYCFTADPVQFTRFMKREIFFFYIHIYIYFFLYFFRNYFKIMLSRSIKFNMFYVSFLVMNRIFIIHNWSSCVKLGQCWNSYLLQNSMEDKKPQTTDINK